MRDLCPASVSALHSDRNRASANASCDQWSSGLPNATRAASVANCGQPRIGTRRRNKPPPPSSRFSALFSLALLYPISGISRDAESEIESWRIELRLARNQRQLFALASLSRLIARHTRSRFASWPRPRFDALECNFYCHHKLRKNPGF